MCCQRGPEDFSDKVAFPTPSCFSISPLPVTIDVNIFSMFILKMTKENSTQISVLNKEKFSFSFRLSSFEGFIPVCLFSFKDGPLEQNARHF